LNTDQYRAQHDRLLQMAYTILTELASPSFDVAIVRTELSRLAGVLKMHLSIEDEVLYAALAQSQDRTVRETARQFAEEMGGLAARFTTYNSLWTLHAIEADPAAFVAETRALFTALAERIDRENQLLYPLFEPPRLAG
jgi:hypothetical protein